MFEAEMEKMRKNERNMEKELENRKSEFDRRMKELELKEEAMEKREREHNLLKDELRKRNSENEEQKAKIKELEESKNTKSQVGTHSRKCFTKQSRHLMTFKKKPFENIVGKG